MLMEQISPELISYKKRVGHIGTNPVFELATTGGLHLIVTARGGKSEVLGTGPHRAVARFIAKRKESGIFWSDLNKSDHVPIEHFAEFLEEYESLTNQLRSRQDL